MPVTEAFTFNVERLMSPIPGENPAGELLRYEGTYDAIREARREEEANLNQGIWQRDLKKADWQAVSDLCLEALEKRSKDLQLSAWLLEAWLHLYGFPGVQEGLRVLNTLCWNFWEIIHPGLDDPEYRLAIFNWIDAKLSLQIKFVPITDPPETSGASAYSWSDWDAACYLEQTARQHRELKITGERVTLAMFQQSVALSPLSFFKSLADDLSRALEACGDLEKFLDGTYGTEAPGLRIFRENLESVGALVGQMLNEHGGAPGAAAPEELEEAPSPMTEVKDESVLLLPKRTAVRSRDEAFQMLQDAADFLQTLEPHSPVPYLVRRAVSWGSLTLEELLPELVRNEDALNDAFKTLQIQHHK